MTNLEKINSSGNSTILGYVGAALFGFIMQLAFHTFVNGSVGFAFCIMIGYSLFIAIIEHRCRVQDCKFGCELNEFWFTIEQMVNYTALKDIASKAKLTLRLTKIQISK